MELLYLWVDDFKKFKNIGFSFSSRYIFEENHFIDDNGKDNLHLTISENTNYISLFPQEFLNVTGILGQNGAGKTTLFNLLKLFSQGLHRLTSRIVFCYREAEDPQTIFTVYYSEKEGTKGLKVKISKQTAVSSDSLNITITEPFPYYVKRGKNLDKEIEIEKDFFDEITTVYFSNTFDTHREDIYEGVTNLSTNSQIYEGTRKFLRDFKPSDDINTNLFNQKNPIIDFFDKELKKQISYITYAKQQNILSMDLPEYLSLGFNKDDYTYLIERLSPSDLFRKEALEEIDKKAFDYISQSKHPKQRLLDTVYLLSFYYALRVDLFQQAAKLSSTELFEKIDQLRHSEDVIGDIKKFILQLKANLRSLKLNSLSKLFDGRLEKKIEKLEVVPVNEAAFSYRVRVDKHLWSFLDAVLNIQHVGETPFFSYSWYGISSGQEAFLSQFARFYALKNQIPTSTLWIIIDEGELYFHPQWQKEYVKRLVDFLPRIFPGTDIQLFISSHSPFVASDLPKNNIIFLRNLPADLQSFDLKETFASNIHTLFTSSFFLDGLIGDFAKQKIDDAINYLNDLPQEQFKSHGEIQKLIRIIGEPLLRNQLQKMLDSKKIATLEQGLNFLNTRVTKLENPKKDDTDK